MFCFSCSSKSRYQGTTKSGQNENTNLDECVGKFKPRAEFSQSELVGFLFFNGLSKVVVLLLLEPRIWKGVGQVGHWRLKGWAAMRVGVVDIHWSGHCPQKIVPYNSFFPFCLSLSSFFAVSQSYKKSFLKIVH